MFIVYFRVGGKLINMNLHHIWVAFDLINMALSVNTPHFYHTQYKNTINNSYKCTFKIAHANEMIEM